jgi:hypothetical protein
MLFGGLLVVGGPLVGPDLLQAEEPGSFRMHYLLVSVPLAYQVAAVSQGGVVEGRVTFQGEAPKPRRSLITKDKEVCDPRGERHKYSEALLVKDGNVKDAVVTLEGIPSGKPFPRPAEGYRLIQKECAFRPHLQVVPAGAELVVLNEDPPVKHESHGRLEGQSVFKFSQDPVITRRSIAKLDKPGVVEVTCDIHGWMSGYVVVAGHPYSAVTGEDGTFRIDQIPPGTYRLTVWHESLKTKEQTITVPPGGSARAAVVYSAADQK